MFELYKCGTILIFIIEYFGIFVHLFEKDYYKEFNYPYHGDIHQSIQQLRQHEKVDIPPINFYNYSFISNCEKKCTDSYNKYIRPRLVYIVKSAIDHFDRRLAIRKSWGYENRFSDVIIRTVFILGTQHDSHLQERISKESQRFRDIVQGDFYDTYFNNTIKTMIGFKWAVNYCPLSKFYMFVDDDMYVSTKNVLRFVRNPTHYPDYLLEPIYVLQRQNRIKRNVNLHLSNDSQHLNTKELTDLDNDNKMNNLSNLIISRLKRQVFDFELPSEVRMFAGYVFISSPHRHKSSKWYITLDEYPYNMWPPYVTAGAFILSKEALFDMYYASFYTKHFRFDDIYLGIVAMKADIEPFHCEEFYFYKKQYTVYNYRFVVASHGYEDTNELLRVWNEQKSAGNA
ncbi:beta-1,3-galactosyltransferase brn [Chrysoperla carnea]|uniref:beta-1,3-galactosyltransferase brn n=1 Tax=Chrysoperla carnea TaxID=189513 RepID=UPI001D091AB4|nr:beta-1,3-galactosyltransferase brn [Chrysoperla carnea]